MPAAHVPLHVSEVGSVGKKTPSRVPELLTMDRAVPADGVEGNFDPAALQVVVENPTYP